MLEFFLKTFLFDFFSATLTTINDEEFVSCSETFLRRAIEDAAKDEINNIKIPGQETPGNKVVVFANELLKKDLENADCQATVQDVIDVVDGVNLTVEKMWKEIHDMATNDTPNNWLIILENTSYSLESSTFSSLYHFILMRLVEYIIEYENEKKRESLFSQEDLRLTEDQQQIVRYVAGYIIFSLTKKWKMVYRNKKSMVASAAVDFLKSIRITSNNIRANSFLDFSMKWVELVNRGGLVIVNDDFFIFIRRIENTVRQLLTIDMLRNYRGEDLRDLLMTSLEKHDGINVN